MKSSTGCAVLGLQLDLVGDPGVFAVSFAIDDIEPGMAEVTTTLTATRAAAPPAITLRLSGSGAGIRHSWRIDKSGSTGVPPDWSGDQLTARAAANAPLLVLHGSDDRNRLTVALADALHGCRVTGGIREEDCRLIIGVEPFAPGRPDAAVFTIRMRLDARAIRYDAALAAIGAWWEAQPGCTPLVVPAAGLEPMYSTWYSFHQAVEPAAVLAECRLARALGCTAVIVDDGWQTLDGARGYGHAGDWRPERMGDMAAFVRDVHAAGMKLLLWYAVALVGYQTEAFVRFERKVLRRDDRLSCAVLDPRHPDVREFIVDLYDRHLAAWDLDGFKLDFVDCFQHVEGMPTTVADGRDTGDIDEAVDRLMKAIVVRLQARKPDILIEFRQSYVGPRMRSYGNLFRAGDCPYDALANRKSTIALRLLTSSATAIHADMLMWHPQDTPAACAAQLQAVLFAVPQVSVLIATLPETQRALLRFWLAWWQEHRACLLDGTLTADGPEQGYPLVSAATTEERITALYADRVVRLETNEPSLWLVNATARGDVVVECADSLGERLVTVRDASGAVVATGSATFAAGLHRLTVPAGGLIHLATA